MRDAGRRHLTWRQARKRVVERNALTVDLAQQLCPAESLTHA
jgi:hypothetical protein